MKKLLIIFILLTNTTHAKKNERHYQTIHCNQLGGKMEVRLKDKTRIDCLTDRKAIEHEWAKKWAECVGQALYYGAMKEAIPVCALIGTDKEFEKYSKRVNYLVEYWKLPIELIHIKK